MKTINSIRGLHSTKTLSTIGKRSIPQTHCSSYLELYMLEKEKERLLVERNKLSIKMDVINNRLEEIEIETKRLVEMEGLDLEFLSAELKKARDENKEWKSVSINY
ncbi:MAG: hypothetical protein ACEPOZ_19375 [Marinifilaceae bacterium]